MGMIVHSIVPNMMNARIINLGNREIHRPPPYYVASQPLGNSNVRKRRTLMERNIKQESVFLKTQYAQHIINMWKSGLVQDTILHKLMILNGENVLFQKANFPQPQRSINNSPNLLKI